MKHIYNIKIYHKIFLILFILISIYIGNILFFPIETYSIYNLVIEKNETVIDIATDLKKQALIKNKKAFIFCLRFLNKDKQVTAGLYTLQGSISMWKLVHRITNGKPDKITITIIPGWKVNDLRKYINNLNYIQHLSNNLSNEQLKQILKIHYPNLEGLFYPDTYYITPGQTDLEIYYTAYNVMQNKLNQLFATKDSTTVYNNPYQLLIMASLIEKETFNSYDMRLVSSVFNNRIRIGMKLQNDPAVFYGLSNHKKITHKDFAINTKYNTYINYGLPQSPICLPSLSALYAASQPIHGDNLYFISSNGKLFFSHTYKQHLKIKYKIKHNLIKKI